MKNEIKLHWIPVKERLPEIYKEVFVAYEDEDTGENKGVSFASLQNVEEEIWYVEPESITGEEYEEFTSVITLWCDFYDEFQHPDL